jgi:hypothetical protein
VSALTGENIAESFNYLIKEIYERNKVTSSEVKNNNAMKLTKHQVTENTGQSKKDKKCC